MIFTILIITLGSALVGLNIYAIAEIPEVLKPFCNLNSAYNRIYIGLALLLLAAYRVWG